MRIATRQDTPSTTIDNDITGPAFKIDHATGVALSVKFVSVGASTGTFTLEATASDPFTDNVNNTANPNASWTTITGSDVAVSVTDDTEIIVWNVEGAYYRGIRLVWDADSIANTDSTFTVDWIAKGPQS